MALALGPEVERVLFTCVSTKGEDGGRERSSCEGFVQPTSVTGWTHAGATVGQVQHIPVADIGTDHEVIYYRPVHPTPRPTASPTMVSCTNGVRDWSETDVDCGGDKCPNRCGSQSLCCIDTDCEGEQSTCADAWGLCGQYLAGKWLAANGRCT